MMMRFSTISSFSRFCSLESFFVFFWFFEKFPKSKIKSLLIYFYYTQKPRLINPLNYISKVNEFLAYKYIKKRENLFKLVLESTKKSNSTGVSFSDYRVLYEIIKKYKPKHILELGSGISSLIMAYALKENFFETKVKGLLETYEEDPFYFKQVKSLTKNHLKISII